MNCINLRGRSLMARNFDRQVTETEVRVAVLNRYSALGTIRTVQVDLRGNTRPSPISPCMALASVVNRSRTLGCACPDMRTARAGLASYGAKGRSLHMIILGKRDKILKIGDHGPDCVRVFRAPLLVAKLLVDLRPGNPFAIVIKCAI